MSKVILALAGILWAYCFAAAYPEEISRVLLLAAGEPALRCPGQLET